MKLYHGSNMEIRIPRILPSQRFLDFGPGFYLTSDFEQAWKWAVRTTSNRETGIASVSVFEFDAEGLEPYRILRFDRPDHQWLRYIAANRTGKSLAKQHDIVIGPVANDQAIRTVNNYLKGYFSEDIAIQLLLPQKLKDQYTFKTDKSLALLNFLEVRNDQA